VEVQVSVSDEVVLEQAQKLSVQVSSEEQARYVVDAVGSRLAAAALGLRDTRTVNSWAHGGPIKGPLHEHRLQALFRVTYAVKERYGPAVAAAFLRGSNPALGNRAPMTVLANESPADAEQATIAAVETLFAS
jgi:hypothetical protein